MLFLKGGSIMVLNIPVLDKDIEKLNVGDVIKINGYILCGRDAALPRLIKKLDSGDKKFLKIVDGGLIFHTAVSVAGVGPTSSNKFEIESSIIPLSKYGIKIHLGKGKLSKQTIESLEKYNSIYCVIPPVTALLNDKVLEKELIAFPELGMEAFYRLKVKNYPAIVAAAHGRSIYDK